MEEKEGDKGIKKRRERHVIKEENWVAGDQKGNRDVLEVVCSRASGGGGRWLRGQKRERDIGRLRR